MNCVPAESIFDNSMRIITCSIDMIPGIWYITVYFYKGNFFTLRDKAVWEVSREKQQAFQTADPLTHRLISGR